MKYVIKNSGKSEKFDKNKIIKSLIKVGASNELAKTVADKVEKNSSNTIKSVKILKDVLKLLNQDRKIALKYNLKQAIMNLGPDGYFFEKYFSKLLNEYGYETKINLVLKGKVITHEVDIIAIKKKKFMVECKYHNKNEGYTTSKEAMYTYARFLDLNQNRRNKLDFPWLVTNTKCSPHAIGYSSGVGLKITSWNYPENNSLQDLINQKRLYPITMITGINLDIKKMFYEKDIIMVKDLLDEKNIEILRRNKFLYRKFNKMIEEARDLMK